MTTIGNLPEVVSRDEWLAARKDAAGQGEGSDPRP